jgi:peptidoglycan/xylan/chitin deacetylase (PgdA/CDA1 family)
MEGLLEYCRGFESVYIYGAGEYGRVIRCFLEENRVTVKGFLISNKEKDTVEPFGVPVYDINQYEERIRKYDGLVIAASSKYLKDITSKVTFLGISDYFTVDDHLFSQIRNEYEFKQDYPSQKNINVLVYHRVGYEGLDTRRLSITKKAFEKQLIYLKEKYSVIRSDEDWEKREEPAVVLTFDDGYCDFYSNVLPLLNKYHIPATVFITTGGIDEPQFELWGDRMERLLFYANPGIDLFSFQEKEYSLSEEYRMSTLYSMREILKNSDQKERNNMLDELERILEPTIGPRESHRIMTGKEVQECAESPFVTIGAHTISHCCLSFEKEDIQEFEIQGSKERLEEITGRCVDVFAYPYGDYVDFSDQTIRIASEVGFKKVFAAYPGKTSRDYTIGRIPRNNISFLDDTLDLERNMRLIDIIYGY